MFNNNYSDPNLADKLLESYILSFDMTRCKLCECLRKVLRNFSLNKDFIVIDKFAKIFSKIYYSRLQLTTDSNQFNSENALYLVIFALIVLDIDFKSKGIMPLNKKM